MKFLGRFLCEASRPAVRRQKVFISLPSEQRIFDKPPPPPAFCQKGASCLSVYCENGGTVTLLLGLQWWLEEIRTLRIGTGQFAILPLSRARGRVSGELPCSKIILL